MLFCSIKQMNRVENLYICGFTGAAFNGVLLQHFQILRYLKIAFSNFTHINNDFAKSMSQVEIVNITYTELAYTRPSLFQHQRKLRILDLRKNKLDHMEGPLVINPSIFQAMYLSRELID